MTDRARAPMTPLTTILNNTASYGCRINTDRKARYRDKFIEGEIRTATDVCNVGQYLDEMGILAVDRKAIIQAALALQSENLASSSSTTTTTTCTATTTNAAGASVPTVSTHSILPS
jgi:hypothetical protein